jgi:hypothetical protein
MARLARQAAIEKQLRRTDGLRGGWQMDRLPNRSMAGCRALR